MLLHISSSYAKILREKLFRTWEFPRSGSKAEDGEKKKKRANNGQATHGARKHAWPTQTAWAKRYLKLYYIQKITSIWLKLTEIWTLKENSRWPPEIQDGCQTHIQNDQKYSRSHDFKFEANRRKFGWYMAILRKSKMAEKFQDGCKYPR